MKNPILLADAFAGFVPRKTQMKAAYALAVKHQIVNMDTGEGKSLVAAIAAATVAMRGRRVYIVTVNNYLAKRDFELFSGQLTELGINATLNSEDGDKVSTHAGQVIFTSVQNLLFDYTANEFKADGLKLDLDFAILDEIDYVLLDSANTRFSVSMGDGCGKQDTAALSAVWAFILSLPETSYTFNLHKKEMDLGDEAYALLESAFGLSPDNERYRDIVSYCHTALLALHCYRNGVDYLVEPDGVLGVLNPYNGRNSRNSYFHHELDYFLRLKERIRFSSMASSYTNTMSAPTLFRKFRTVTGLSGTAKQASHELRTLMGSGTKVVLPFRRSRRRERHKHFRTQSEKTSFMIDFIRRHGNRYAYLVICEHELEARKVFEGLDRALNREITLLTNDQLENEQEIIDNAGRMGRVLVSTHLVGRGTDIVSDSLAVLVTHHGADVRADRQAAGRTGRNGLPGAALLLTSDEDTPRHHHLEAQRSLSLCEDLLFENAKEEMLEWVQAVSQEADDAAFEKLLRQEFMFHWLDFRQSLSGRLLLCRADNATEYVHAACLRMREELRVLRQDILECVAGMILRKSSPEKN
jgi:preprotein translocase subunit SecA